VLETGDGRTSKFSGDGAPIRARYQERYQLDQDESLSFNKFISEDKKLTHDLAVESGHGHLVPEQVCFPREYRDDLWRDIRDGLGLGDDSHVVLKLCNRSRAAGVLVASVRELDEMLRELLVVPSEAELEQWLGPLAERMLDGPGVNLGCEAQSFEEQRRHWWSNESPVFVAERLCTSVPCESGGRSYDATMRVGFALRRRAASGDGPPAGGPDELAADWLGGYWKLPASPLDDGFSRSSCISAARTAGTAPVPAEHLHEVFAALGGAVQQLFSSQEPCPEDLQTVHAQRHGHGRELTAFFTARLGTSCFQRSPAKALRMLEDALQLLDAAPEPAPCQRYVRSFVHRSLGCVVGPEEERPGQLRRAAALHPSSALALFWLGASALQSGAERLEDARAHLARSLLLDPDLRPAYVCLAVACIKLGLFEERPPASRRPASPGTRRRPCATTTSPWPAASGPCSSGPPPGPRARAPPRPRPRGCGAGRWRPSPWPSTARRPGGAAAPRRAPAPARSRRGPRPTSRCASPWRGPCTRSACRCRRPGPGGRCTPTACRAAAAAGRRAGAAPRDRGLGRPSHRGRPGRGERWPGTSWTT
ncbi:unnamed protein product, partial [Prorocentrum cordatum]